MSFRNVSILLAGLVLPGAFGCNEIVGIKAAQDTSGTGGTGSTDSCNPELEVTEARAIGCMFRIACDPFLPPFSMSECMSLAWQDASPAESCTFGAESCGDIDACIGRRYEPAAECEDITGWTCDESGERAINCTQAGAYSVNCDLFDGSCAPHASTAAPTAFACAPEAAPTCPDDAEPGEYFCDGTVRFTCIDGEPRGVDCAAIDSECIEFAEGEAYCSDRTEECTTIGSTSCNGDVIEACDTDGYRVAFDCSAEGLECAEDSETELLSCLAPGCDTATDCTEACLDDARTLRFCAGGVAFSLDCTRFGYDGCVEDQIKGGVPLAYCAVGQGQPPHP